MRSHVRTLIVIVMLVTILGCGKDEPQKATQKPVAEAKVAQTATAKEDPCSVLKKVIEEATVIIDNTEGADLKRRIGDLKIGIAKTSKSWSETDQKRVRLLTEYIDAYNESLRLIREAKIGTAEYVRDIKMSEVYDGKQRMLRTEMLNGCK